MRTKLIVAALSVGAVCLGLGLVAGADESVSKRGRAKTYEVTFTNISHGVILTPPIFALSHSKIDVFEVGEPASLGLAMLAEGGLTDELRAELEAEGVQDVVQTATPVMPGESITVELEGNRWSRLNLASMLLPTNDGFVAMNGSLVFRYFGDSTFYLNAYDAGSELNDELCASIPGPQCGGEGFNEADGEGYVVPHAAIHGEAELSRQAYNWGDPVAKVTVRAVH